MIATMKVLGLKARDYATLSAAARRVVEYVQGGPTPADAAVGGYYVGRPEDSSLARGSARGVAAELVGLRGEVEADQLHRLLLGRHAVTGEWLLDGRGSAGRAVAHQQAAWSQALSDAPDVMTLAQAARTVGVSPAYLRRLAETFELESAADDSDGQAPSVVNGEGRAASDRLDQGRLFSAIDTPSTRAGGRDVLHAFRDPERRRWLVSREEVGRFMAERQPPTVVIGYDLVCSAPKSVSLLWAFGDEDLRADVSAALDAGIAAAFGYLERHAAVGTVQGRNRAAVGLAAAAYRHEISRSEEAHLHVHNIIVNAIPIPVVDEDGAPMLNEHGVGRVEWRALDSEVLLRHVKTAGYVGAAALRHELARRRGLSWEVVRNGVAELADFPREILEVFSTRTGELTEEFIQLVDAGFNADAATLRAAQRGSRAAKRVLSDPEVEAIQRRRLAEAGYSVEQIRQLGATRDRRVSALTDAETGELFDRMVGPGGLAEHQPLFTQREVYRYVAAAAGDRLDAAAIGDLAQRFLADPRIVLMRIPGRRRRNEDEDTYTTVELLEIEDALMALYRQGRVDHGGPPRAPVEPTVIESAIETISQLLRQTASIPSRGASTASTEAVTARLVRRRGQQRVGGLAEEQAELVRQLLGCGDLIRPVVGPAGTGKTEAMRAVVDALARAGYTVLGTANGGRQAEELHDRLQVRSQVVSGWLTLLDHSADPVQVWRPGTVLILDEATQVSTRDGERLLRYASRTGTVVILVGDVAQLGSVGAGGWFRHLVHTATALADGRDEVAGLRLNQRQTGPGMRQVRAALAALRRESPAADHHALRLLAGEGRIRVFASPHEMLAGIVADWYTERRQAPHPHAVASAVPTAAPRIASGDRPVAGLDHGLTARSRMMAEHHSDAETLNLAARARLTADGTLTGPVLRVAGREFQAGDEVITLTQAGHTLVPIGQPPSAYIRTGTIGVVTAVHLDPAHPDAQRLSVLFPGRGEVHVDWDYLTHAFPDGRDGGLGHAYALTAHKAEGATMPTSRSLVTDDASRAGLYVMLSRAKHDLRAYVIRRPDLEAHLEDEDWLPVMHDGTGPLRRLLDHLAESRPERLATEHDPIAHAAHQLARRHTLAELTHLRRAALARPRQDANEPRGPGSDRVVESEDAAGGESVDPLAARRAELAAETTIGNAGIADPPTTLVARIGPRPNTSPARRIWDDAVAAVAILRARNDTPNVSRHLDADPPADTGEPEREWQTQAATVRALAHNWAQVLGSVRARRFHSHQEAVPRQRATAGIHALLAAGHTAEEIYASLIRDGMDDIRAGAAVMEYRVRLMLDRAGLRPDVYELPAPLTPQQEWTRARRLLHAAEARHLATRPTSELAIEHRDLTDLLENPAARARHHDRFTAAHDQARAAHETARQLCGVVDQHLTALEGNPRTDSTTLAAVRARSQRRHQDLANRAHDLELSQTRLHASQGEPAALHELQDRRELLNQALEHQIHAAATRLVQEPAPYLIAILGTRPQSTAAAHAWNHQATAIEHYRHTVLGLPYGTPAAPLTGPATHAALGPPPDNPTDASRYAALTQSQATLEFDQAL